MSIISSIDLGENIRFVVVDHDPTSVATDLYAGSIIMESSTGYLYWKSDTGSSTNVYKIPADPAEGVLSQYDYAEDNTASSTTLDTWQDKLTLTTDTITGLFRVFWSAVYSADRGAYANLRLYDKTNSAVIGAEQTVKIVDATEKRPALATTIVEFDTESREITLQYKNPGAPGPTPTITVENAFIDLFRAAELSP
jgi:hypothetical protein